MWINIAYAGMADEVRKAFKINNPNSIQLREFLHDPKKLILAVKKLNFSEKYVPDLHRYEQSSRVPKEVKEVMKEITVLVELIAGRKLKCKEVTIKRFGKKHYTLIHDAEKEKPGIDFVLNLTEKWENAGGSMIYTKKGEDVITISPAFNTFSLMKRAKGTNRFVKYVNHKAKGKVVFIQGTFR